MIRKILALREPIVHWLDLLGMNALMVIMRIWMAKIFWYSGLTKISSWSNTLFLFQYEYKVPIIPFELAAYFATAVELTAPILLVLGLFTRLAALPMLAMTIVIQTTYLDFSEHYFWGITLLAIIFYGAGKISLDHLLVSKLSNNT